MEQQLQVRVPEGEARGEEVGALPMTGDRSRGVGGPEVGQQQLQVRVYREAGGGGGAGRTRRRGGKGELEGEAGWKP